MPIVAERRRIIEVVDPRTGVQSRRVEAGTVGASNTQISTNCLRIELPPSGTIWYKYTVRITKANSRSTDPKPLPKQVLRFIWQALEEQEKISPTILINTRGRYVQVAFDGRQTVYSPITLAATSTSTTVNWVERGPQGQPLGAASFDVSYGHVHPISLDRVRDFIKLVPSSHDLRNADFNDGLAALKTVFHHSVAAIHPITNRNVFYIDQQGGQRRVIQGPTLQDVGSGLELLRGVFLSISPVIDNLILNLNLTSGVFIKSGDLSKIIKERMIEGQRNVGDHDLNANRLNGRNIVTINRWLKGLVVLIGFRASAPKKRKISVGLLEHSALTFKFFTENDQMVSVAQYFLNIYGIPLRYPEWPVVEINKGVCYPLELLSVLPGSRSNKRLTAPQQEKATRFQQLDPASSLRDLQNIDDNIIRTHTARFLQGGDGIADGTPWDVGISQKFRTISNARFLPPPQITAHDNSLIYAQGGKWNLRGFHLLDGIRIRSYAVVVSGDSRGLAEAPRLFQDLFGKMYNYGIEWPRHVPPPQLHKPDDPVEAAINSARRAAEYQFGHPAKIIFWIFDREEPTLYAAFKNVCMKKGYPSQALRVDAKTRGKITQGDTFAVNLALKINGKLRGLNWSIVANRATGAFLTSHQPMVWGIDVTHEDGRPSIASVCASMDRTSPSLYQAECSVQPRIPVAGESGILKPQETIRDLQTMVLSLLQKYVGIHNRLPSESMIFYRDGVSDSEWQEVINQEVEAIATAFSIFSRQMEDEGHQPWKPHFAFILCVKSHHVRFYPANTNGRDKNVRPGLIVDQVVTHPHIVDWYAVSHAGIIGTSRPTRYVLLTDTHFPKMTLDEVQGMTHDLCHTFQRAIRTVKVPAPVYYCDIICRRLREMISAVVDSSGFSSLGSGSTDRDFHNRLVEEYRRELNQLRTGMNQFNGTSANDGTSAWIPPAQWWL